MRTCVEPFTLTATTTRSSGMDAPPPIRNSVCSGELTSMLKVSSKPLVPTAFEVTLTDSSASSTVSSTGTGTAGPM